MVWWDGFIGVSSCYECFRFERKFFSIHIKLCPDKIALVDYVISHGLEKAVPH